GKVLGDLLSHDSSSGVPFGQNQPIKAMATGIEPHTTAHGLKIDQISMIVVAMAAQNGQIEFRGEASRASGLADASVVTTTSRRSVRNPVATGRISRVSQSRLDPRTTGMRAKLYGGAGEDVAHSSVAAFHGLS